MLVSVSLAVSHGYKLQKVQREKRTSQKILKNFPKPNFPQEVVLNTKLFVILFNLSSFKVQDVSLKICQLFSMQKYFHYLQVSLLIYSALSPSHNTNQLHQSIHCRCPRYLSITISSPMWTPVENHCAKSKFAGSETKPFFTQNSACSAPQNELNKLRVITVEFRTHKIWLCYKVINSVNCNELTRDWNKFSCLS